MFQYKSAATLALCCAVAGCDSTATSDLTEPEPIASEAADAAAPSTTLSASNTWATKRSLSPWRMSMAAETINGIIYVVGGRGRDGVTIGRTDAYNVATNTWSQLASMPSARAAPNGASIISGKLYVTGGYNRQGAATKTLFVYDPRTNTWTRKADMPRTGCGGDQGVISGRLYVYTGCYAAKNMGRVFFRYNPATDTWVTRVAPPVDHSNGAGGVVNGMFYLAGGYKLVPGTPTNSEYEELHGQLHVYNPATNTWMTKAPMSRSKAGMAAAMLNGKLFLAGGASFGGENPETTLQAYDPMANRWTMKAPMPNKHSHGAAATAGGRFVFIAGYEWLEPPGPSKVYAYMP